MRMKSNTVHRYHFIMMM